MPQYRAVAYEPNEAFPDMLCHILTLRASSRVAFAKDRAEVFYQDWLAKYGKDFPYDTDGVSVRNYGEKWKWFEINLIAPLCPDLVNIGRFQVVKVPGPVELPIAWTD